MAMARINGVGISYRQVGAGADVVLLHGLAANQAFWGLELVAALARDFRVTTFDLRGHGYSEMPPAGYRPVDLATDLGALLDHLRSRCAHLVGHSFGGVVALQFAVAHPGRVSSLVLADARIRVLQPRQPLLAAPDWPALRAALARCGTVIEEGEPEIGVRLLEALAAPSWDGTRRLWAQRSGFVPFAGGGKRAARRWLQLLATTSARDNFRVGAAIALEQLARLHCPVLAVYGERSPNHRSGQALGAWLSHCQTVIVPGAGHFHPVTRAQFFRDAVLSFLRPFAARAPAEPVLAPGGGREGPG